MIALIQRVSTARVEVEGRCCAEIGAGLLALIGVQRGDGAVEGERLLERILGYRVFDDDAGRMNRSLRETAGGLLLVPPEVSAAPARAFRPRRNRHWHGPCSRHWPPLRVPPMRRWPPGSSAHTCGCP